MENIPTAEGIEHRIYLIRNHKVMLDMDLALLYGVSTARLNEQVRRNILRFPTDFMFQLNPKEFRALMSQFATSKPGRGGRRKLPLVFTQEGVAMLSGILHSSRAIQVNVAIMRAFVHLRKTISTNKELSQRLDTLEKKYDKRFRTIFDALRTLMEPPRETPRKIGFSVQPPR